MGKDAAGKSKFEMNRNDTIREKKNVWGVHSRGYNLQPASVERSY